MTLTIEAQALLNRMTPEERKEAAKQAIAEYNAAYEAGGEMEYPMWADAVLKACDEAERLAQQVVEMGGKK